MTSSNDDLMPTGMGENTNQVRDEFNEHANGMREAATREGQDSASVEMQDTTHRPHAYPAFHPPWDTSTADSVLFNRAHDNAIRQHTQKEHDAFDQIDKNAELTQDFNTRAQGVDRN